MSRCFPFPPPGYESKAASDQIDLLVKEKHKERKHKKDKKDREKRESKEKKDKDKSRDKHREKKDRKEKHSDKKKDKDKDKDKDKSRTSDDRRIEDRHEVKLGDSSQGSQEAQDFRFTEELGKRIRDEKEGAANSMSENFTGSIQRKTEGIGIAPPLENRKFAESERNNGIGQPMYSFSGSVKKKEGMGSATYLSGTEKSKSHGMGCTMDKPIGLLQERNKGSSSATTEKERGASKVSNTTGTMVQGAEQRKNHKEKEKRKEKEKEKGKGKEKDEDRGSQMVANLMGTEQRRSDGMGGSVGKDMDSGMEGKKARDKEADAFKGEKHFDGERNEKRSRGNDKERHKEKEKEKVKEKGENKHKVDDKPRDNGKRDMLDSLTMKPSAPHRDNSNNALTDGNISKRKDIKMNGFLHENVVRPSKILRTSFPSDLPLENGKNLESGQIARPSISPGSRNSKIAQVPGNKKQKINGITESRPSKPPHPDSKYLSQIYSVPKLEEWPEFDDQEWLFGRDDIRPKHKAKPETQEARTQVWAEAMQIESVDVVALPYVIPF